MRIPSPNQFGNAQFHQPPDKLPHTNRRNYNHKCLYHLSSTMKARRNTSTMSVIHQIESFWNLEILRQDLCSTRLKNQRSRRTHLRSPSNLLILSNNLRRLCQCVANGLGAIHHHLSAQATRTTGVEGIIASFATLEISKDQNGIPDHLNQ